MASGLFFGQRRSNARFEAKFADPVRQEVPTRLVQADRVCTNLAVRVAELYIVVLPETDVADHEGPVLGFGQSQVPAAWACEAKPQRCFSPIGSNARIVAQPVPVIVYRISRSYGR